jgi:hypothetical protein
VFLIVGLGNPGKQYRRTRHNLGFMVLESLAVSWDAGFKKGRGPYTIAESDVEREKVLLAKPATYMNRSGYAVGDLFRRHPVVGEASNEEDGERRRAQGIGFDHRNTRSKHLPTSEVGHRFSSRFGHNRICSLPVSI